MTNRPTPETQAEAIRSIADAFRRQGITQDAATASILAVLDTSSTVVNGWATGIVTDAYTPVCTCAAYYLGHALHAEGCVFAVGAGAL